MITGQLKRVIELQDNFRENDLAKNSNIVSFISGKGGTGKTVISILTAMTLASENKKVLLFDLDLGFPNINVLLNQNSVKSLDDFFFNNKELSEVITKIDENLHIIYGLSNNPIDLNSTKHLLKSLITEIKKISTNYDYVILDSSAGIDEFKLWILKNSGIKIIVTNNDPSSIMDAYALIKIYENSEESSDFLLLINRCENVNQGKESFYKLKKAVKSFLSSNVELFTIFLESKIIKNAVVKQEFSEIYKSQPDYINSLRSSLGKLNKFIQLHNINHPPRF